MPQIRNLSSIILSRADLAAKLGQQFGGARKLYEVFGYKKHLTFTDYLAKYKREDLASRIINAPAEATWRGGIKIEDEFQSTEDTLFEIAVNELANRLKLWHYMERADKLAGLGRYAVLLIGAIGNERLDQPIQRVRSSRDILYISVFSEESAHIKQFVEDPRDPDFGEPLIYEVSIGVNALSVASATTSKNKSVRVHKSRIIHIADGLLHDDVYGTPRLEKVFNRLDDLAKVVGGSAEAFWLVANRGLHIDVDKEMDLGDDAEEKLTEEVEEYQHQLRRFIRTRGVNIESLGAESINPEPVFKTLVGIIAGATGIPQRILLGSEMGQLASSQDRANWADRVSSRQKSFAESIMLRPFIDRLIQIGALPDPLNGQYEVQWPSALVLSEQEKAQRASTVASASNSLNKDVINVGEFREKFLDLPHDLPKPATRKKPETLQ